MNPERALDDAVMRMAQCEALERAAVAWMRSLSSRAVGSDWFDEFEAATRLRDRARDERGQAAFLYVHINEELVRRAGA